MPYNPHHDPRFDSLPPLVQDPSRSEWPSTPFPPATTPLQFPSSPPPNPIDTSSSWGGYGAPTEHAAWGGAQGEPWGQTQSQPAWGMPQPHPQPESWPSVAELASSTDPFNTQARAHSAQPTAWGDPSSTGPTWGLQPTPSHSHHHHSLPTTPYNPFPDSLDHLRDDRGNLRPVNFVGGGGDSGGGLAPGPSTPGPVWGGGALSGGTYEPRTDESSFNGAMQLWSPPAQTSASWSPGEAGYGGRPSRRGSKHHSLGRASSLHSSISSQRLFDRPGSWRPDFKTPRSGLDAIMAKKKAKSFPQELADSGPHTLNPHIRITLFRDSPSTYDLRLDLSQIQFKDLKRPVTSYDLAQFATEPPLPFMRLSHSRIPWYIDVYPQNATGVTLYDLFSTMHGYLYQRIKQSDFWNTEMGEEDRAKITASWRERVGRSKEEAEQGVLKIDFLRRDCIFLGLKGPDKEGVYEMRTRKT